MTWNLWIDDMRDPAVVLKPSFVRAFPEFGMYGGLLLKAEDFIWSKRASDAQRLVKNFGPPKFMALDHDLGDHTVFEFLKWLAEEYPNHPPGWRSHSANPEGVKNINAFMQSWHKSLIPG